MSFGIRMSEGAFSAQANRDSAPRFQERRQFARREVHKFGTLHFRRSRKEGMSSFSCDITSLSKMGGRITVASTANVPQGFEIRMPGERSGKPAAIVWRTATELGFAFQA